MELKEQLKKTLIVIRGAGDLATGTAIKLHNSGFPIIMLEISQPTVIRTTVSFATAMFNKTQTVEGVQAVKCNISEALNLAQNGTIALINDPTDNSIKQLKPKIVIDAIIAKKNLGTSITMADFVIALGPGFNAGKDCHAVIETQRGHNLGKIIYSGTAAENTGIPGIIAGVGKERVMHSPCQGIFNSAKKIGDIVEKNTVIAYVNDTPVISPISGKVRGMLTDGLYVTENFKVADVDPRGENADHTTCSDKSRAIAGGVLEAVMHFLACNDN